MIALLRHLFASPGVSGWLVRKAGYAFLRPGREHAYVGPAVAGDLPAFEALMGDRVRAATAFEWG